MLSSCVSTLGRLSFRVNQALPAVVVAQPSRSIHGTACNEAARKGTREKARKKKVKVEVKKVGFIPHNQRNKDRFVYSKDTDFLKYIFSIFDVRKVFYIRFND